MSKWLDLDLTTLQLNFKTPTSSRQPMNCIIESQKSGNYGQLWLGNIDAANDKDYLDAYKIGAVLSVIDTSEVKVHSKINRLWIMAEDCEKFQLMKYFDEGADFIRDNLRKTNVLVHCYAGISRSSSMVLAYMIKHLNYDLKDALRKVKSVRPQVEPNSGFMDQLLKYERKMKTKNQNQNSEQAKPIYNLSKPRGSVVDSLKSSQITFLDKSERFSVGEYGSVEQGHYIWRNTNKKQQSSLHQTQSQQSLQTKILKSSNFSNQKSIENIWSTPVKQSNDSTIKNSLSSNKRLEQVKLAIQSLGSKDVFTSSLNSHRSKLSLGNMKL